jgi:hypothetical protein
MSASYPGFARDVKEPDFKQRSKNRNGKVVPEPSINDPFPCSVDLAENQTIFSG